MFDKATYVLVPAVMALAAIRAPAQTPLGTDFTYQGQLQGAGIPVVGAADFEFALFDAVTGGSQVGPTLSGDNVGIVDGLFTISLDFGADAFDGDARWLEVTVRSPAGAGDFTTLAPRQPLTVAPYALQTRGMFVDESSHVGIGTTAPASVISNSTLDVVGGHVAVSNNFGFLSMNAAGNDIGAGIDTTTGDELKLVAAGSDRVIVTSTNKVGIGTMDPNGGLHVVREPLSNGGTLTLEGITHSYIAFFHEAGQDRKGFIGYASAGTDHISVFNEAPGGNIVFATTGGRTVQVPVLEIYGADVAERFLASETLEPGMVVAIDKQNPGKLCLARGAYNRCVAGIVSGANNFSVGAVLGSTPDCKDAPPIALSGRVYVHCDSSSAPIEPGDLLTTSDVPGHAMKVADYPRAQGAIIGKAMTALESGRGMVLVLVNLQ